MKKFPTRRKALTIGVILAGMSMSAAAQDDDIEEVVVTGSYIRGSSLDAPSPVQVIDRASIEEQGASTVWDVIRNMDINQGSDTNVNGSIADSTGISGAAQVNLRNLGGNSTLTLINGKRVTPSAILTISGQEFVDLNDIPVTMTERVEVLTDGGSALYGSDAVAGVVNVIMRTEFEGLELYAETQGIDEMGGTYEETLSGIWGWESNDGRTNLVLSGEYFERDPVGFKYGNTYDPDRFDFVDEIGFEGSAFGPGINPAFVNQGLTDLRHAEQSAQGETPSGTELTDPLCGQVPGTFVDTRFDALGNPQSQCWEDITDLNFLAQGQDRKSAALSFEHEFSERTEFYSFVSWSDREIVRQATGITFPVSASQNFVLAPPGSYDAAGLSFFEGFTLGSMAGAVGNSRPTADTLTNAPFDRRNDGPGIMTFGSLQTEWPRDRSSTRSGYSDATNVQMGLRGDFDVGDRTLEYDVSASWSYSSTEQEQRILLRDRFELALMGLGGPSCTPNGRPDFDYLGYATSIGDPAVAFINPLAGFANEFFEGFPFVLHETLSYAFTSSNHGQGGCEFYNPTLTSLTNPDLANSRELLDWIATDDLRFDRQNKMLVLDAVVNGELVEVGGGMARFAAGLHYRDRDLRSRAPDSVRPGLQVIDGFDANGNVSGTRYAANHLFCSFCVETFEHSREVTAAFVEFSLPLWDNFESQIAARFEDYGGNIGSNVSPKVAVSWRPIDELLLRASYSQSFRAPTIQVVEESFESFFSTPIDPLANQAVRAGLLPPTDENGLPNGGFTRGQPNPNLKNEEADTFNIGFQWTPSGDLDGLAIGADIWRFEVEDRVVPRAARAAIDGEIANFLGLVDNENNYVLNSTIDLEANPRNVSCSPSALETEFGQDSDERLDCVVNPELYQDLDNIRRAPGDPDAGVFMYLQPAVNAGKIEVQGIDLNLAYSWETEYGSFRAGVNYTHVDEYLIKDFPGLSNGLQQSGKFDAAGVDGEQNIVREVPDNRGTLTLGWNNGNHSVTAFNRHIGSFQILSHDDFINDPDNDPVNLQYAKPKSASYDTWDLQYTYTHNWENSNIGSTRFTIGVLDATNENLPLYRRETVDGLYDPRGRRWYARALWQF